MRGLLAPLVLALSFVTGVSAPMIGRATAGEARHVHHYYIQAELVSCWR